MGTRSMSGRAELEQRTQTLSGEEIDLGAPLTDAELVGAYKVLAYAYPNRTDLCWLIKDNRRTLRAPEGVFLTAIALNSVERILMLRELRDDASPYPIKLNFGATVFGVPGDYYISAIASRSGSYEPLVQAAIERALRPGYVAIDIGANLGFHAALMCHCVGEGGKVLAFEPLPKIFAILERVKDANSFSMLVLYNAALSDSAGEARMLFNASNIGSASVTEDPSGVTVACLVLDDMATDLERVDLIKVDVEGFEHSVFNGAWKLIERHRPVIVTEFSPGSIRQHGGNPTSLLRRFEELGYLVEVIGHPKFRGGLSELVTHIEDHWPFVDLELRPFDRN
jgi:FkbM family methyltransferase